MNLRVRSVTAGNTFVSAMLGAACLPAARGIGFAGAGSRGRLEAAAGKRALREWDVIYIFC
jgi:hypothetical protein